MSLFDVRHQPKAHRLVQHAVNGQRFPHAYIFAGPEGVGRKMFAERLAGLLLCESIIHPDSSQTEGLSDWPDALTDVCGQCKSCQLRASESHPDLHMITRELIKSHPDPTVRNRMGLDLSIDVIRTFVIDQVGHKPVMGRAKVFIVREADLMSRSAQNALLKTLEEPPATTFLILLTQSVDALLPTTRSRCQVVPFGLLPTDFVTEQIQSRVDDLSPEDAMWYADIATGSLGLALQFVEQDLQTHRHSVAEIINGLTKSAPTTLAGKFVKQAKSLGEEFRKRDKDISDTEAQRRGLRTLFLLLASHFRSRLRETLDASTVYRPLTDAIQAVRTAESQLKLNTNVTLTVESLLIQLGRLARG